MSLDSIIGLMNVGVAGIMLVLFITGLIVPKSVVSDLKQEKAELQGLVSAERDRADAAVAALQASKDVIEALRVGIGLGRSSPAGTTQGGS